MSHADSLIRPVPGPRWTSKRLIGMLIDCYGPTPRGAVNVAAVADYAGVSSSTVRRWIAGGQQQDRRRRKPAIPKHRVTQLQRGPEVVERRNQQQYQYALDGLRPTRRRPGHPAGLASARVAQRAHRRHRRNPRKALAPGRCHQSQQASTGRTPAPRHLAGQRHATVTVSRTGTNACGDDPPTSLADPPHTAATIAGPNTGVDGRRAASGSRGLSRINRPIVHRGSVSASAVRCTMPG